MLKTIGHITLLYIFIYVYIYIYIYITYDTYFIHSTYEGFYCWIMKGGEQNVWANILIFKFIIPQIS